MIKEENISKKKLQLTAKMLLVVVLFAVLFKYDLIDIASIHNIFSRIDLFAPAIICLILGILISGFRWWMLLNISACHIHLRTVVNIQLIGSFFSTYLPGAAGGDAARGLYVFRILNVGRSVALISIVTDRIFSLIGLLTVAWLIGIATPALIAHNAAINDYAHLANILFAGLLASVMIVVGLSKLIINTAFIERLPFRIRHYISVALSAILMYHKKWGILLCCWIISTIASGVVVLGIILIAQIFPYSPRMIVTAIAAIFGNLSSAIPLTPGGIGIGEAVFSKVCSDLSSYVAPFATIYFAFRIGMLFANIPGLVAYLLFDILKHKAISEMPLNHKIR